jgi:hypothetical protein
LKKLLILLSLALSSLCATAAIIRVPADRPTIQAGIDAAVDGDTVLLADGRYTGKGNRGVEFRGKAITLRSENGPETCIIDAEFAEEWFEDDVLSFTENEGRNTVVDGLTITGGYTYGISVRDAALPPSPIIRNCIITGNNRGLYLGYG